MENRIEKTFKCPAGLKKTVFDEEENALVSLEMNDNIVVCVAAVKPQCSKGTVYMTK